MPPACGSRRHAFTYFPEEKKGERYGLRILCRTQSIKNSIFFLRPRRIYLHQSFFFPKDLWWLLVSGDGDIYSGRARHMDHASGSLVILRDMFRCFLEKQDSTGNFLHNLVKKKNCRTTTKLTCVFNPSACVSPLLLVGLALSGSV